MLVTTPRRIKPRDLVRLRLASRNDTRQEICVPHFYLHLTNIIAYPSTSLPVPFPHSSQQPVVLPPLGAYPTSPNKFRIILRSPLFTPRAPTVAFCSTPPFGRGASSWECQSESRSSEKSPSTCRNLARNTSLLYPGLFH